MFAVVVDINLSFELKLFLNRSKFKTSVFKKPFNFERYYAFDLFVYGIYEYSNRFTMCIGLHETTVISLQVTLICQNLELYYQPSYNIIVS